MKIHADRVLASVRRPGLVVDLVQRQLRLLALLPQRQAALLETRLWVVPFLLDDELLETREEADLRTVTNHFYFSKYAT